MNCAGDTQFVIFSYSSKTPDYCSLEISCFNKSLSFQLSPYGCGKTGFVYSTLLIFTGGNFLAPNLRSYS